MKKAKSRVGKPTTRVRRNSREGLRKPRVAEPVDATTTVVLDPAIAKIFPDSRAVNDALRAFVTIVGRLRRLKAQKADTRRPPRS